MNNNNEEFKFYFKLINTLNTSAAINLTTNFNSNGANILICL